MTENKDFTKKELIYLVISCVLTVGALTLIVTGNSLFLVTSSRYVRMLLVISFTLNSTSIFYGGLGMSQIYKERSPEALSKSFNTQACGVLFSIVALFLAYLLHV